MPTPQQAAPTQQNPTPPPDLAEQILRAAPVDDNARADAWDAFHQSQSEEDLTGRLQKLNLPQSVKADLWDAKHSGKAPNNTVAIGGSPVDLKTGEGGTQAATAQASAQSMNLPAKDPSHVRFLASDNTIHDVAAEHLDKAKQIDPTLKVIDAAGGASDPDVYDKTANVIQGAKDSAVGHLVKDVTTPPASVDEHVAMLTLGPGGLPLYRQAKALVDSAKNVVKASGEAYPKAIQDFKRMVDDFRSGNFRQGASSAVSTASDAAGIVDPTLTPLTTQTRELSEGARPGGNLATPLTRQVLDAGTAAVGGPKLGEVAGDVAEGVRDAASRPASTTRVNAKPVSEINPESFLYKEKGAAPQHGTPVQVESPLDSAAISKSLGGKDLSSEAVKTLQSHVGDKIPVGSTPKTQALAAVEKIQKTISETASKMNQAVKDAPKFTTSVAQDNAFGEGSLVSDIDKIKAELPPSVRKGLSDDVDAVMQDADRVLNSSDPTEVLEQRRLLGNKIDWENIVKTPTTPAEAQNLVRVKVYQALGDKIHTEIPETFELDKTMQPNLELRSHLRNGRLGERAFEDPQAATAEAQQQAKLGKDQIDVEEHNKIVRKNRELAGLSPDVEDEYTNTSPTAVDKALDKNVQKFNLPVNEQAALKDLLKPTVKAGRFRGTNTSWYDGLKKFDELTPQERSARFTDPNAVRNVLRKQASSQLVKAVAKYGSTAIAAHALGIDKAVLTALMAAF